MEYKMYAKMIVEKYSHFKHETIGDVDWVIIKGKLRKPLVTSSPNTNDQAKQRRKQKRDIEKEKKAKQLSVEKPDDNLLRSSGEETVMFPLQNLSKFVMPLAASGGESAIL
ncbi:LOW QUALITY PROTEIN: hypothetical protein DAPPUDRAFT_271220 [Daphnia pulex]|uniref:Uncharacterized protein n=1 Tax=Daphnia pulex TaxID=6669 RepID=E9I1W4_DAPPU|nr:LOW QUALITY PROTEIN: hypothetical protein DAPPUDRAFT_271220 [Daphnia pulex]|eukprot:EFX62016.1 LOW QUALITY PROTEIN: hypothetical protein DAPPUDRAFT_271220 [Daphnia pulex]